VSTSTSIVSLAADLVVFLAAASLLFVLVLRSDLLGVTPLFRAILAGAASLLAGAALIHGGLDQQETWLSTLRLAAVVFLAVGCLGVTARWPRTALLASLGLLVVAEIAIRSSVESFGNLLRFLGGCGIGLSLWLAARRSLATRIAAAAAILLVTVVLVLSGVLSQVLTNSVSQQALVRAKERANIEADLVVKRADVALSQASFIARVLSLADIGRAAVKAEDPATLNGFLNQLKSLYSQVDFLAFLGPTGNVVGRTDLDSSKAGVLDQLEHSPTIQDAYSSTLASPQAGVEPTLNAGLVALGVDFVKFPDERGVQKVYGTIVAGFFLDPNYLKGEIGKDSSINLSILTSIRLLATTLPAKAKEPTDLLDGKQGQNLVNDVFSAGKSPAEKGVFDKRNTFLAIAPIQIHGANTGQPKAALAVTVEGSVIDKTRSDLFHKLFFVALAAAVLALALAAAAGSRLGAPLRKLALTASQISRGDLSVRSGLRSSDEIGLLGASFDEMAGSIERMASELREGAAQMEAVLNSMTDALVAADPLGLVAMMNPAAEAMLGVRATREMGKPVAAVIRAEDRNGNSLVDRFELPNFEAWSAVGMVQTSREGLLPVALSGAPIRSEQGGVLGAVYVLRDMRRELEIERAKTEFLSNISHELRTPLTPIKGYAEMLRRDQQMAASRQLPPEKRRAFLDGILESSERLERTVDILVNFAAMEAGRLVLRTEPVDSANLVHEVCERWRSRSGMHRVEELVNGRPRVLADRRLLERSIDELIDNAVKFSPEGGVVTVRTELVGAGDGRAVEISVSDEGIGIAPSDFDRIFTDFSQIDGSATRRYGGLGLGLPFVQRVVAAHGGTLRATSEPGHGSTFTMELPISAGARGNGSSAGAE